METYKGFRHDNRNLYFRPSVSWGKITSSGFSARYYPSGFTFDSAGISIFPSDPYWFISLMNSIVFSHLLECISPTLNFTVGDISRVPIAQNNIECESLGLVLIEKSKQDWNAFETSWDFQTFPLRTDSLKATTIQQSFQNWQDHCTAQIKKMQELETENNRLFIEAYGLQDELKPEVSEEQITLARADQEVDIKRLLSYSIGCMMGRYSLDEPGLIYAHRGNEGFDHSRYTTFSTDDDGIIPVMDMDWFDDDATNRFIEFLKVTWGADTLDENLQFIAQTLKQKKSEEPEDTIRRYLSTTFFKDHLKIYKKRPIYWLFSSGKQKAFTCLVYLHRYNESTLPRMRSAYVTPLQGKFNARLDYLRTEINQASTTPAKKKLQKELETIKKKQTELTKFDEELRHYADKRISLDLDDGVKINYGKFGTLLAEKKSVTGKK
jgi:type II restriction/modification system DNA methylase subunit YeeA